MLPLCDGSSMTYSLNCLVSVNPVLSLENYVLFYIIIILDFVLRLHILYYERITLYYFLLLRMLDIFLQLQFSIQFLIRDVIRTV